MKKKVSKTSAVKPPLETGQVWQCKEGRVLVGLVGKTLVHYKFYRKDDRRPPVQLTRHQQLKSFLQRTRAVLQPNPAGLPEQVGGKQLQFGRALVNPTPSPSSL